MNTVTIPRKVSGGTHDLVVISRKEYEALLARPNIKEFTPTKTELKALRAAEKRFAAGKYHTLNDVQRDLAHRRRR